MVYLVLGSGLQGRVVALDILNHERTSRVILADRDESNLELARGLVSSSRLETVGFDIDDHKMTSKLMARAGVIINSLPHTWEITEKFYRALAENRGKKAVFTDYWMWEDHYAFSEELKETDNLAVPGLGIVPGFGNICAGQMAYEFDQLEEVMIYCGGLPTKKGLAPLDYMVLFNMEALLDLYLTPPTIIEDGKLRIEEALSNLEDFFIPGYGRVEALRTDGLYSLNRTLLEKGVRRAAEYTLRYPGHYGMIKRLDDMGFLSKEEVELRGKSVVPRDLSETLLNKLMKKIPGVRDFTYLRVDGRGRKGGSFLEKTYELLAYSDEKRGITSMERTTAYPSSIAAMILAEDDGGKRGVVEPETIFVGKRFKRMVEELASRGIMVYEK